MRGRTALLALLLGCTSSTTPVDAFVQSTDGGTCTPPMRVSYSCSALPAGSSGCTGNPPAYGTPSVPDPSAAFSDGCVITMPYCHPAYPGVTAQCTCASGHWGCPL